MSHNSLRRAGLLGVAFHMPSDTTYLRLQTSVVFDLTTSYKTGVHDCMNTHIQLHVPYKLWATPGKVSTKLPRSRISKITWHHQQGSHEASDPDKPPLPGWDCAVSYACMTSLQISSQCCCQPVTYAVVDEDDNSTKGNLNEAESWETRQFENSSPLASFHVECANMWKRHQHF